MKIDKNASERGTIISARFVLPVSSEPFENSAVLIRNGTIDAIDSLENLIEKDSAAEVLNFPNAVLMPGFVNAHSHLELTVLRGYLDRFDDDFAKWLFAVTNARDQILSADEIRTSAFYGVLEGVASGVTCFADIGRLGFAGMEALNAVGLRGISFQETEFSPENKTAEADFETLSDRFQEQRGKETKLVRAGISPHSCYTVSPKLFGFIAQAAKLGNIPLSIHAAESIYEIEFLKNGTGFFAQYFDQNNIVWKAPDVSPIEYLESLGILEAQPLLAHCVEVSEKDLQLIAQGGARIAHCPKSNAKLGHGIAPFAKFLSKGIKTGLGSDSVASNNLCDFFEEARFACLVARVGSERFLSAREFLRAATFGGAEALGLDDEIGSIEVGKRADLVVVSLDSIGSSPVYDVTDSLLFSGRSHDVCMTMVDGNILYKDGEFSYGRVEQVREEIENIRGKLVFTND
ncbi:MAG: amidohydrolase family protein [Pyrinomonadaceae bacterium]